MQQKGFMFHLHKITLRFVPAAVSVIGAYYVVDTLKLNRSSVKHGNVLNGLSWDSKFLPKMLVSFNAGLSFDTKVCM